MSYCLGILTRYGIVLASDSRTNAGIDQINTCRKMHTINVPGERTFVILASGSLSLTQSVITLTQQQFQRGEGLAVVSNFYEAARCIGEHIRVIDNLDREFLEKDNIAFSVSFIIGGQIKGEPPQLYLIYAQGNPLQSTPDSPYLQIGEIKYGKPILDRGIRYDATSLDEAAMCALISLDSTMKSNKSVGPPIDLLIYKNDEFDILHHHRFDVNDPQLMAIRSMWEQKLKQAIRELPPLDFTKLS